MIGPRTSRRGRTGRRLPGKVQFVYVVSGIDKPEVDKIQPESPGSNDNVSFFDRLKALFS